MQTFFSVLSDSFSMLDSLHIFGNISVLHILLAGTFVIIIGKLLKGNKTRDK